MSSTREMPYPYPISNSDLVKIHGLIPHPEGGFFCQTAATISHVPEKPTWSSELPKSDLVQGKGREHVSWGPLTTLTGGTQEEPQIQGKDKETDATMIYYLLTGDSPRGTLHVNVHPHFHCHHAGRSRYTLIFPSESGAPKVKTVTMGPNVDQGEVTQLYIPGGVWKCSQVPDEDLELVKQGKRDAEHVGGLITEVVVPGWYPGQFEFMTEEKLKQLWHGEDGWQKFAKSIQQG